MTSNFFTVLVSLLSLALIGGIPFVVGDPWGHIFEASWPRILSAIFLPIVVSWRGLRKSSLKPNAIPIVLWFGSVIIFTNFVYGLSLLSFFFIGSAITKFGRNKKIQLGIFQGTQRNWIQAVSNATVVMLCSTLQLCLLGPGETSIPFFSHYFQHENVQPKVYLSALIQLAVLGSLATCCGDTFASELGPLFAKSAPVLITEPWRRVPFGTNGGVTLAGTLCSGLGGLVVGLAHFIGAMIWGKASVSQQLGPLLLLGCFGGMIGSFIDSILGALFQQTVISKSGKILLDNEADLSKDAKVILIGKMPILDNNLVNYLSSLTVGMFFPFVFYRFL